MIFALFWLRRTEVDAICSVVAVALSHYCILTLPYRLWLPF